MKPEDKARHKETYDFLNNVGCGFCLAKWTQVTIHLASGITHSCHHVGAHTIPLDELEKDPGALHNTSEKKQRRKEMLAGQRPAECDYCWRIEDNTNEYSDRILKSSNEWSQVDKDKIAKSTGDENFYPRSVEVSFSNVCNFKCSYCGPPFSSKWAEEIKQQGPYKLSYIPYNTIKPSEIPIPEREHNPYIEAFWKWFPDAVTYMHVFRIKVIDYLLENPQPQLGFAINSNACPPGELWDKFISKIQQLEKAKAVKYFTLYTSAESFGEQAEYSRDGMDWELFTKNIDQILSATDNVKVVFMSAFNILSLPSLRGYLRYTNNLKRKFQPQRISLDFAYVRHPELIDKYLKSCIDYMVEHRNAGGRRFFETEIYKLNRIYQDCMTRFEKGENVDKDRKRFSEFVEEYDKRRNKSFVKTFPEFKQFLAFCKGK
jgi:hypothetical protein